MRKILVLVFIYACSSFGGNAKKIIHFIDIPLMDATCIYTGVKVFQNAELTSTKISAGTSLGLLATNSAFGALMAMNMDDKNPKIRTLHRITAYTLTAASIWLSLQTSLDDGTKGNSEQYTAYGFTGAVLVPVIMFKF